MLYYVTSNTDDDHALLLEAPDDAVAAAAILSIGGRSMGLLREDGGFVMPNDLDKASFSAWIAGRFGVDGVDTLVNGVNRFILASALDSFFTGTRAEYRAKTREWSGFKPDIRAELRKAWDDTRNGGPISTAQVAWGIAAKLREMPDPTPPLGLLGGR